MTRILATILSIAVSLACTAAVSVIDFEQVDQRAGLMGYDSAEALLDSALAEVKGDKLLSCVEQAQKHYWDLTIPSHNERLMMHLLENVVRRDDLPDEDRMRVEVMLEVGGVNKLGEPVHDLEWETVEGANGRLSNISTPYTLLFFNDPDCESCHKVKERLDSCSTLRTMTENGTMTVVAVYPYDDMALWKRETYPDYMLNVRDHLGAIDNDEAYVLPQMPLFYLVDRDKRLLLKNEPSLNRVLEYLTNNKPN